MNQEKQDWKKEFGNIINSFSKGYSIWQIFKDFLLLTALSLANTVKTREWDKREEQYLSIIHTYQEKDQALFPQLLACLYMALTENPEQDFLGEIYALLNLQQEQKGQFFTPYHIAHLMSELTYEDRNGEISAKGYISINDSACGSGVMLIAATNTARSHGLNPQKEVLFVGQDIDRTAALMCYIQLALLELSAYVIIGDSLARPGRHPDNEVWYTPAFYRNVHCFVDKSTMEKQECGQKEESPKSLSFCEDVSGQLSFYQEKVS